MKSKSDLARLLENKRFPLSAKYDPEWVMKCEMGPNALWLTELLAERMSLKPGMRVLDMGCGRAMTSIFLAKEFGVQVWATDLWIPAGENWQRIREAGVDDRVFPIHADAHSLPYAEEFFVAVLSMDSYQYYGTDDLYFSYFVKLVKRGGRIGIVVPGITRKFNGSGPAHLGSYRACFDFHTADWWCRHWKRTGLVEIETAEAVPGGGRLWCQWEEAQYAARIRKRDDTDVKVFRADKGKNLGFVRLVGRRVMTDPVWT